MRKLLKGNEAVAYGAKLCRPQVISAYPITPQTVMVEKLADFVADGELDCEYIKIESEHSALSSCVGASGAGVRVFTATSSQGLALMHEIMWVASGMRLPIVMGVANRALSAPINIWCDTSDVMAERDSGWIQLYAADNQEALDSVIMLFKVSEDKRVLLPSLVTIDGFVLSHTYEGVDIPDQDTVDKFLPPYKPEHAFLDPSKPMSLGTLGTPATYMESRKQVEDAMRASYDVVKEVMADFAKHFGRKYEVVEKYMCDDAEIVIIALGSSSGTGKVVVNELRKKGKKVGLARIALYRPFPVKEIAEIAKNAKVLAIVERAQSYGHTGPVYADVAAALAENGIKAILLDFIAGLGGRDIVKTHFEKVVEESEKALKGGKAEKPIQWLGLKEELL